MQLIYISAVVILFTLLLFYVFLKIQRLQKKLQSIDSYYEIKIKDVELAYQKNLNNINLDNESKIKSIELMYQKEINKINIENETKIKNILLEHQEKIKNARQQSVNLSRSTIKGQIAEQLAPLLSGFPYLPSDCRFIGSPVDYLIFNGYTDWKDNQSETPIEIIIADIKHNRATLTAGQKQIAKAIELGRVRFETVRISETGTIETNSQNSNQEIQTNVQNSAMQRLREQYPNAYKPWTLQDDDLLKNKFLSGVKINELSLLFERKPGAINSRLIKIGLIEDVFTRSSKINGI